MPTRRVRLRDVAEAAGVSPTTASFVLNNRCESIPPETRKRVLEAAERLHYRPNVSARALATGKTRRIGIVLNQPESFSTRDTYFSEVLEGIIQRATEHDRNVLLLSAHYPHWRGLFADITGGSVDGVLQISRYVSDQLLPVLLDSGFPVVCVSFHVDHPACFSVDCDNVSGGRMAARHLLSLGHRSLAVLYPGEQISWGAERMQGIQAALTEHGLDPGSVQKYAWDETALPDEKWVGGAVDWLLHLDPRPTGVICCDEIRARLLTELLPRYGVHVPDDLSVISFNSTEISERATPPLTSVRQPLPEIGRAAVDMLLARIRNQEVPEHRLRFPMHLDVRESTTRLCDRGLAEGRLTLRP